jgi:hypothetical protein
MANAAQMKETNYDFIEPFPLEIINYMIKVGTEYFAQQN